MKGLHVLAAVLMVSCAPVMRAQWVHEKAHLSPYFLVEGDNTAAIEHFPLLKTEVRSNIAGMIAENELIQVYKNDGEIPLEALYVFPLGTRSAIHAMKMKIGERILDARIEETGKAQQIYRNAKDAGKTTSLLVQKRPNVFQMKVANILPGDIVEVITQYTEILVPEKGVYTYVFPTVVGPRFTGESDTKELENKDSWVSTPYTTEGKKPSYDFNITVSLKTGIPLSKIWSGSHKINVRKHDTKEAIISLSRKETKGGNRDFILNYSLKGKAIQTGLLLYPDMKENYFLLMVEPPEQVALRMVPPREYLFVVDVSGSMHGFPMDVSKVLIKKIIGDLRKEDYLNILFFAGGSNTLSPHPLPATEKNKRLAIAMLESMQGGGGTRILDALNKVIALEKKEGLSRIIIAVTDGYVSVEKKTFDIIRDHLGEANFFAFGIGSSVNRYIIEGMARAGKGEPFIVTNQKEAEIKAETFLAYVKHPLLTDIKVAFNGFDVYDVEPKVLPDLFAERPLVVYGKYKKARGTIKVTGNTASGKCNNTIAVTKSLESKDNGALKYIWAREKIARLADYGRVGQDVKDEVMQLGLTYHLITEYTSFVAVDSIIRNNGTIVSVKQPLPLPQGVSNRAIGSFASKSRMMRGKMKCAEMGATPAVCEDIAGEKKENERERDESSRIVITGGKVLPGMSLYAIEKIALKKIGKELGAAFDRWGLTRLSVILKIEKGRIVSLTVEKYTGKKCQGDVLLSLFKKIKFKKNVTGTIELDIDYRRKEIGSRNRGQVFTFNISPN